MPKAGMFTAGQKPAGWVKGASVRIGAAHQYHAGKAIGPCVKSAKTHCAGKPKKT